MDFQFLMYVLGGTSSFFLLVYLIYALLCAEEF